jgi:hypothetical protein
LGWGSQKQRSHFFTGEAADLVIGFPVFEPFSGVSVFLTVEGFLPAAGFFASAGNSEDRFLLHRYENVRRIIDEENNLTSVQRFGKHRTNSAQYQYDIHQFLSYTIHHIQSTIHQEHQQHAFTNYHPRVWRRLQIPSDGGVRKHQLG